MIGNSCSLIFFSKKWSNLAIAGKLLASVDRTKRAIFSKTKSWYCEVYGSGFVGECAFRD